MSDWQWKKKESLAEQLKFFGCKPKHFISVYCKTKPRIRIQSAKKIIEIRDDAIINQQSSLCNRGMQNTGLYNTALSQCNVLDPARNHQSELKNILAQAQAEFTIKKTLYPYGWVDPRFIGGAL